MAFDPALPADHSPLSAAEMRAQFTALADRITALELAIGGTAKNPSLGTLSLSLDDPPTRPQVQAFLDDFNALLNQITRV